MNSIGLRVSLALALICAGMICGCGQQGPDRPATFATTGTVTLDGAPVEGAAVTFVPNGKGTPAVATTDASGRYALKSFGTEEGAVPGQYMITVTKGQYTEAAAAGGGGEEPPPGYDPNSGTSEGTNTLPKKYESPQSSGLTAAVTEDPSKNTFDLALESGDAE